MRTLGVIGCGNMGAALVRGIVRGRIVPPGRILCWDPEGARRRAAARAAVLPALPSPTRVAAGTRARSAAIRVARSNAELARRSSVILLAVKPQQMADVLAEIRPHLAHRPLLISIAAGIRTGWIERRTGGRCPVVRVMPNTPALVGAGISAVASGRRARADHMKQAERILRVVGEVVRVPERWMDAVTAVSGSGPAYFFHLMEQMIRAGTELGLAPAVARRLVLSTAAGAASMAVQGEEPAVLRAKVTSKGGTTEAAFRVFDRARLAQTLRAGIRAAARRSRELSR